MRDDTVQSADIILRVGASQSLAMLTMTSTLDNDPVTLEGTASTLDRSDTIGIKVDIPLGALEEAVLEQTSETDWVFRNEDGTESGFGVRSYAVVSAIDNVFQIHSGVFFDDAGNETSFVVSSDPVPAIVWIVGIGAAACLLAIGIDALTTECKSSLAPSIEACNSSNGLPEITVQTTFGMSFQPKFNIGCNRQCLFVCKPGS